MKSQLTHADLMQFTGTENWYHHALVCSVLFTDGAKFLADRAGAYWLLDEIAFAQKVSPAVAAEAFQVWTLTVADNKAARLACDDGNGQVVHEQKIPFTDFPLEKVTLYVCDSTILLPSEY